jgi:hypothetical protein
MALDQKTKRLVTDRIAAVFEAFKQLAIGQSAQRSTIKKSFDAAPM